MTAEEFESRIAGWARQQPDIEALVQIGSRVQAGAAADDLADWDYHLITGLPGKYADLGWLSGIAPVWCANLERSSRNINKASAVFVGGLEADFVLLPAWQMKLVYWAMGRPHLMRWMPCRLRHGIRENREILLGSGHRVIIGGRGWEQRLTALSVRWDFNRMSEAEFRRHLGAFWQKSVWVARKIARPEPRSAMHWLHKLVIEHVYALLEEEAWLGGRTARPEARKAEQWLDARRLKQTDIVTNLDQRSLAQALLGVIDLFKEAGTSVAAKAGFKVSDHSEVERWLRTELGKLL